MGTFTNQPSPQADFDMILVAVGHWASACPLGTLYPLVTVIGYRARYVVLPVSVWGKIIFNYFSKAKMVGRVTRFFTLKGSHAHIEDSFSFKKCIKKVVEQAVVHSSINKWNSCRGTAGGRLLLLSYSRGNSSHLPSLCYNFTQKSVSLRNLCSQLQALEWPPLVSDNGVIGCVYHCCIIDSWKIVIDEVKFIQTKQGRPNRLNLDISKVFSNTAMTA